MKKKNGKQNKTSGGKKQRRREESEKEYIYRSERENEKTDLSTFLHVEYIYVVRRRRRTTYLFANKIKV